MNKPEKFNQHQAAPVSWRDVLPVHPAADLFPLVGKDELRELADDIDKNDLQDPVILYRDPDLGDCLLDGRNRLDALELLGEEIFFYPSKRKVFSRGKRSLCCDFRRMDGPSFDPYAYVISKNVHRRHLTPEQKRDLIAKLLKAKPEQSNLQIAKQVKADDKTVAKVRTELESTSEIPKLTKTVGKDGKSRPARKPKAEQKTFASPQEAHDPKTAPKPISKQEIQSLSDSWLEVHAQIRAGNRTRLKGALELHRERIERVLEGLTS